MAYAMTKHGNQDNQVTNEFICDAATDLAAIDKKLITLGSVALVLDGMEAFIANSNKQWISMTPVDGGEE